MSNPKIAWVDTCTDAQNFKDGSTTPIAPTISITWSFKGHNDPVDPDITSTHGPTWYIPKRTASAPVVRKEPSTTTLEMPSQEFRDFFTCSCNLDTFFNELAVLKNNDLIRSIPETVRQSTGGKESAEKRKYNRPTSAPQNKTPLLVGGNAIRGTPSIFMGRHSSCHNHDRVRDQMIRDQLIRRCEKCKRRSRLCNVCEKRARSSSKVSGDHKQFVDPSTGTDDNDLQVKSCPILIPRLREGEQRKNFQPLPKHNHVRRGSTPHFCNFVRNKQIHDRPPEAPSVGHGHQHGHSSQGAGWTNAVRRNNAFNRPMSSGTEGRPSSPSEMDRSGDSESQIEVDPPEVPRVEIREKIPKPVKPKAKPKAPKPAWAPAGLTDDTSSLSAHANSHSPSLNMDPANSDVNMVALTNPSIDKPPILSGSSTIISASEDTQSGGTTDLKIPLSPQRPTTPTASQQPVCIPRHDTKERQPVKKKDKKPFVRERSRNLEDPELNALREDIIVESEEPEPEDRSRPKTPPPRQTPPVPAPPTLPSYKRRETPKPSSQRRPSYRSLIVTDIDKHKIPATPDSEHVNKPQFYEFTASMTSHGDHSQRNIGNTWSQGRLALSQQSSRFELPMDMKMLETMEPTEYLAKYCVVTSKRQWLYEKIYLKHKDAKLGGLSLKGLEKALKEALVDTIDGDDVTEMVNMGQLNESSKIDQKLFIGIAAMAERVLYPKFLTEDTQNIKDHKKEKIECADFCGLEWKFHGVEVNPAMRKLLEAL